MIKKIESDLRKMDKNYKTKPTIFIPKHQYHMCSVKNLIGDDDILYNAILYIFGRVILGGFTLSYKISGRKKLKSARENFKIDEWFSISNGWRYHLQKECTIYGDTSYNHMRKITRLRNYNRITWTSVIFLVNFEKFVSIPKVLMKKKFVPTH